MYENLLPLGSIILAKGANKRLMIVSRIVAPRAAGVIYDYAGCLYPEGIVSADELYFFNRDNIERVYFIGFQDEEELRFAEELSGLGELYVGEDGEIAEREAPVAGDGGAGDPAQPESPAEEVIEVAVFADVD